MKSLPNTGKPGWHRRSAGMNRSKSKERDGYNSMAGEKKTGGRRMSVEYSKDRLGETLINS